jgi:hypothetical protein
MLAEVNTPRPLAPAAAIKIEGSIIFKGDLKNECKKVYSFFDFGLEASGF